MLGVFLGSLGFPVVMVLQQNGSNWKKWNLHTKLTIQVSLILLGAGTVLWGLMEWENVRTIGGMSDGGQGHPFVFASVMTRPAASTSWTRTRWNPPPCCSPTPSCSPAAVRRRRPAASR